MHVISTTVLDYESVMVKVSNIVAIIIGKVIVVVTVPVIVVAMTRSDSDNHGK